MARSRLVRVLTISGASAAVVAGALASPLAPAADAMIGSETQHAHSQQHQAATDGAPAELPHTGADGEGFLAAAFGGVLLLGAGSYAIARVKKH